MLPLLLSAAEMAVPHFDQDRRNFGLEPLVFVLMVPLFALETERFLILHLLKHII